TPPRSPVEPRERVNPMEATQTKEPKRPASARPEPVCDWEQVGDVEGIAAGILDGEEPPTPDHEPVDVRPQPEPARAARRVRLVGPAPTARAPGGRTGSAPAARPARRERPPEQAPATVLRYVAFDDRTGEPAHVTVIIPAEVREAMARHADESG